MDKTISFKVGDNVIGSAAVTGTGENIEGYVSDTEVFAGQVFVSVNYYKQSLIGDRGRCVTNLGLLTKLNPTNKRKR